MESIRLQTPHTDAQWHVVYSRSRAEKKLAKELNKRGIEAYCPIRIVKKQWTDRIKSIEEVLFTSYCFVKIAAQDREKLFEVPGFVRFVYWLGAPAIVKDKDIEKIQLWLQNHSHDCIDIENIVEGDVVQISSGNFRDMQGKVLKHNKKKDCLELILESLGKKLILNLKTNTVKKVTKASVAV
jgi:transcriptional antiterminator RfaH